VSVTLP
ncbi:hypothetical protein BN1723_019837, partial [Verticillium longisporum]